MNNSFEHLLSPLRVGNVILRNRLFSAPMGLHSLQGSEAYPTQAIIQHYAEKAKGGAAVVTCSGTRPYSTPPTPGFICYDLYAKDSQHYLSQMADAIHFYGAKASMEITAAPRDGSYQASAGNRVMGPGNIVSKEITEAVMEETLENLKLQVTTLKRLGYDMVMLHIAYNMGLLGSFISLRLNRRTDQYGGPIENRVRFLNRCCDAIHEAAGRDFLIELRMSGELPPEEGFTMKDACRMAKALEGHVDLLQVHAPTEWQAHPMCFEAPAPNLWMAEAMKKSGVCIPVVTIGGYQDLDEIERLLSEGKADAVSMARGWLADPYLGVKAQQNRSGDVVPCVKCMRCHDSACIEGTTFVCTVNPEMGISHNLLPAPAAACKRVAVVGGGPAGMEAAITLHRRGHQVTLFEATERLGGQLNFADYAPFKSALSKYKQYLIRQVEQTSVSVRYQTAATRELLLEEGYDAVILAVGAAPIRPDIPGAEAAVPAPAVFGAEQSLGQRVVIIGGGQVGCEAALYLSRLKKTVTVLEQQEQILADASPSYRSRLIRNMDGETGLTVIPGARCTAVGSIVRYRLADGTERTVPADSVVLAVGMRPKTELALSLQSHQYECHMVGDCQRAGNVQKAVRSAFAAASVL